MKNLSLCLIQDLLAGSYSFYYLAGYCNYINACFFIFCSSPQLVWANGIPIFDPFDLISNLPSKVLVFQFTLESVSFGSAVAATAPPHKELQYIVDSIHYHTDDSKSLLVLILIHFGISVRPTLYPIVPCSISVLTFWAKYCMLCMFFTF